MIADPNSTTCGNTQPPGDSNHPGRRILAAADALLQQGELFLWHLPRDTYAKRIPAVLNGSMGSHYRHGLDHFASLLRGESSGLVDFDSRDRDVRIESDAAFAVYTTQAIRAGLAGWSPEKLSARVTTRCEVSDQPGIAPVTGSTLGRELVYAIIHGVHHYAMISVIARMQGIEVPEGFGLAPSTAAYLRSAGSDQTLLQR